MKSWILFLSSYALVSCMTRSESAPESIDVSLGDNSSTQQEIKCKEDEKRACHVTIGQHEGVVSCFIGIQKCVNGEWSECSDE